MKYTFVYYFKCDHVTKTSIIKRTVLDHHWNHTHICNQSDFYIIFNCSSACRCSGYKLKWKKYVWNSYKLPRAVRIKRVFVSSMQILMLFINIQNFQIPNNKFTMWKWLIVNSQTTKLLFEINSETSGCFLAIKTHFWCTL